MANAKVVLRALAKVLDTASKELFAELERLDEGDLRKLVDGTLACDVKFSLSLKKVPLPSPKPVPGPDGHSYAKIKRIISECHTEQDVVNSLTSRSAGISADVLKAFAASLGLKVLKKSSKKDVAQLIAKHPKGEENISDTRRIIFETILKGEK
ncbi:MAG: hypothetical protein LBR38_02010 [Synergistaceae bacterium]|jgi:hypothetical protein|nr:hypothetical protein [Synergistaceae bacterium]